MTRRIPTVHNGALHEKAEQESTLDPIAVESGTWYGWLEQHDSFRFESPASTFTARKEQRAGSWYWYAYRRHAGRLRTAYLGKSPELTLARLQIIADELAGMDGSPTPSTTKSEQIKTSPLSFSSQQSNVSNTESESTLYVPLPLTPLIGREQEVATAGVLLQRPEVRLLTMVGMAGVGKTRLALQVAFDLQVQKYFADGVYFVALAPVRDPQLVLATIAQGLELRVMGGQSFLDVLKANLNDKHCLLLLDNFEQVIEGAAQLSKLLEVCPHLKLLVTSREVLHLRAEHQFSVPPLALPDLKRLPDEQALAHVAGVELFLQRAQAIRSDFQLTTDNAAVIAEICHRLDGLPLAIELAAARVKLLPPQALLAQLDRRLQVLTGGARDLPERQRTLRSSIAWSYELLSPEEQRLFRRLSIFPGGATLEAIEAVTTAPGDDPAQVMDGIASLIDKSLLPQVGQQKEEPRLTMLETIRDYGLERLAASGEMEIARQEHGAYYQALAREGGLHLNGIEAERWLHRLEQEHDNLRAALQWLLEQGKVEQFLRMSNDLSWFWLLYGHLSEGRRFLERGLSVQQSIALPMRARTLQRLGMLVINQGETTFAEQLWQESLALFEEAGDKRGRAWTILTLAVLAETRSDYARARHFCEQSLALFRELGDEASGGPSPEGGSYPAGGSLHVLSHLAGVALIQGEYERARSLAEENLSRLRAVGDFDEIVSSLNILAEVAFNQEDYDRTRVLLEESLVLSRQSGVKMDVGVTLILQGEFALLQGDTSLARVLVEESVGIWREVGDLDGLSRSLCVLGRVATRQSDYLRAQSLYEESLAAARKTGSKLNIALILEGLAEMASEQGKPAWAARLWGAAGALRETMDTPLPAAWRTDYERLVSAARVSLPEKIFTILWSEGRSLSLEDILADREPRLALTAPSSRPITPTLSLPAGLTPREVEVLCLLAQGLTSAQIAEQLVIGLVTVNSHVRSIYNKLEVTSRSAATRYAIEHKLI